MSNLYAHQDLKIEDEM